MLLRIDTQTEGNTRRLTLAGELELSTVDEVRSVVQEAEQAGHDIEIDMSDLAFMDSSGLQVLLECHLHAEEDGRQVTLLRPSVPVRRLFELTGLDSRFAIRD